MPLYVQVLHAYKGLKRIAHAMLTVINLFRLEFQMERSINQTATWIK